MPSDETDFHDGDSWNIRQIANRIESQNEFKCVEDGQHETLYHYKNGVWKPNGNMRIEEKALNLTNELLRPANINQVKRIIKNRNRIDKNLFEMKDFIIPFENGVYDVKEDEFNEHHPNYNLRFKHPIYYIKAMEEQEIKRLKAEFDSSSQDKELSLDLDSNKPEEFIKSLIDTDRKESILRETVGLSLLTNYPIQEAPVLYGRGKNGKNMYVEMLKNMSGNWHSMDLGEFADDRFASAELLNSTFVFFDEVGYIKDPNKLKSFTGDEDTRIRKMQQEGEMGKQRAIPIIAGNEIPDPPEQNDGFFRRFCILDFPYKFTNQDDEHKDQIPKREIQEEYFNIYQLSKLATDIVEDLKPVIEKETFSKSYNTEIKKQLWNMKSSLVYTFLDLFVEQGELPNQGSNTRCDIVRKDKLLEMCNKFIEQLNGTKIRKNDLANAIKYNPVLETGADQRVSLANGKETRAFSGIKMTLPSFHDYQGLADLESAGNFLLLHYSDMFEVLSPEQFINTLEVTETDLEAKMLKFLQESHESTASLLSIIKALDLSESDIEVILDSDYISLEENMSQGLSYPEISIDREAFNKAVEDSDTAILEKQKPKSLRSWMKEEISSWSVETEKNVSDFLDKAEDVGFNREKCEDCLSSLESDGFLMRPKPDKLKKI